MTWSAPSERTKSSLSVLQTPVTSAPRDLAIWTANGPTLPDAPSIRTLSPGPIVRPSRRRRPWTREDRRVRERRRLLERHPVRASTRTPAPGAHTYSANAPWPLRVHVAEDLVAGPEPGHARPDRLDDARDVESRAAAPSVGAGP